MLAQLEEHPEDAWYQLGMAAADERAKGRLDALVHGLLCTKSLLDQDGVGKHAPPWLACVTVRDS